MKVFQSNRFFGIIIDSNIGVIIKLIEYGQARNQKFPQQEL